jgi:hypothetical protein
MSTTPIADMWRDEVAALEMEMLKSGADAKLCEAHLSLMRVSFLAGACATLAAISGWEPGVLRPQLNSVAADRVASELTREWLTGEAHRESAQGSEVRH